ncbi:hypothetical protein PbB2_02840 [Candidatus Phycosocius bacilliformis]|uniref:Helicase ATP-binding domain-containing protein n=1 Tax=Candidatus Phycosocius bacilliformis TaxID=1445552 RepID=A0A2P2EDL8_9PROT|nr:strawberry notch family protein [Candidatus Phycosocius bacilliformis]GBF59148.1 hypothetical protein PbB2_02840 [Candidatus Phycosocius bacilliformis]
MSLPLFSSLTEQNGTAGIIATATQLAFTLQKGKVITTTLLSELMTDNVGGTDADGMWHWRDAYDAVEMALAMTVRRNDEMVASILTNPHPTLEWLHELMSRVPTQTKRSDEQVALDQFSTPLTVAALATIGLKPTLGDLILEPSAGNGLLAIIPSILGAKVLVNEIGENRNAIVSALMHQKATNLDGTLINHTHPNRKQFSAAITNPPFTKIERHLLATLDALAPGGRMAAITYSSDASRKKITETLRDYGKPRAILQLPQTAFSKTGTSAPTDLIIFDKVSEADSPLIAAPTSWEEAADILMGLPARESAQPVQTDERPMSPLLRARMGAQRRTRFAIPDNIVKIDYSTKEWDAPEATSSAIYAAYKPSRIKPAHSVEHPSALVQSAAMASLPAPIATYVPELPKTVTDKKLLSDPQLETLIYAGQAHSEYLPGRYIINEDKPTEIEFSATDQGVLVRRGYFLGDGTGVGKGRQAAAIILDNLCKGRTKAIWISKNSELLEDARRDWTALGGVPEDVQPLSTWSANDQIPLQRGILFATYGSLRQAEREGRRSRLRQITEWFGKENDGVILFDESHALANATASGSSGNGLRGRGASQQGVAGLSLQNLLPNARVVYISATGAQEVEHLAYAARLGIWGAPQTPFPTREAFVTTISQGGVAALEILCRDLYSLGSYTARNLSFEGVEYEQLTHELTPSDIEIYDAWADAWRVVLDNLNEVLEHLGITTSSGKALSKQAKASALSTFYSAQQRFFAHMLQSLKTPSLIARIEAELAAGNACIIQLVSTNEALLSRRLQELSPAEWSDLTIDTTPTEYIKDYLNACFPIHLYEEDDSEEGAPTATMVKIDGQPLVSDHAVQVRDDLIERIASLPSLKGGLDQLIHHFGTDRVAEITGRSKRVIKRGHRLMVERRPPSSSLSDANAFAEDTKQILIFSDAGGTGRSYHADKNIKNQRRRVHFLLEAGWKAQTAIQGLGRSNRTNQSSAPIFIMVTTNLEGEKRFTATIAQRLDKLGAATRGERRTGGQNLFKPEDAIQGPYTSEALNTFYKAIANGTLGKPTDWPEGEYYTPPITCGNFERLLNLSLTTDDGSIREDLPPLNRFLARILALPVQQQNTIFGHFLSYLQARLRAAEAAGVLDKGMEDLVAPSIELESQETLSTDPRTGAATNLITVTLETPVKPMSLDEARSRYNRVAGARYIINQRSGRAGLLIPGDDWLVEGVRVPTFRLIRPTERREIPKHEYADTHWEDAAPSVWANAWTDEIDNSPKMRKQSYHLLTGLLMEYWKLLPPNEGMQIRRVRCNDGSTWLGRLLPDSQAETLLQVMGKRKVTDYTPASLCEQIKDKSAIIVLTDGSTIKTAKVANKARIEVRTANVDMAERLTKIGAFSEIIEFKRRYFIPWDNPEPVLSTLLTIYPIASIQRD